MLKERFSALFENWIHCSIFEYMKTESKFKPTAIRLNELKAQLQQEAMSKDRSLNWLVRFIIKDYLKRQNKRK